MDSCHTSRHTLRVHGAGMSTLNVRLPEELEQQLAREAERAHKPRSELARDAIRRYLTELERERFLEELTRSARVIANEAELRQEAVAIAEEFRPLESDPDNQENAGGSGEQKASWWR